MLVSCKLRRVVLLLCFHLPLFAGFIVPAFPTSPAAYAADRLWNVRQNGDDRFHSNESWLRPWRYSYEDGWGRWVGNYSYEVGWGSTRTQPSGSLGGISWSVSGNGDFGLGGARDNQWHAWTYVRVSTPRSVYISGGGDCVPRIFLNYAFDSPRELPATLDLQAGWNRIDVTGYNQNDGYSFSLGGGLADRVDAMNSSVISPPAAPTLGAPRGLSTSSIEWPFTDNSSDEQGFRLIPVGLTHGAMPGSGTRSSFVETSLQPNTQYTRYACAYNEGGDGSAGGPVSAYTLAGPVASATCLPDWELTSGYHMHLSWNLNGATSVRVYCVTTGRNEYQGSAGAFVHAGLQADTQYEYCIYTLNGDGIESPDCAPVEGTAPSSIVGITSPLGLLQPGLNLISLPLRPVNPDPTVVFSGINVDAKLYRWDNETRSFVVYDSWTPYTFGDLDSGQGFWLFVDDPSVQISYDGYREEAGKAVAIPKAGWYLMGSPFSSDRLWALTEVTRNSVTVSLTQAARSNGWLDSIAQWYEYPGTYKRVGLPDDTRDSDYLQPWRGYWVYTYEDDVSLTIR